MSALPRILGASDLPIPELCAARLDGELFRIAELWAPIDVVDTAADRAAAASVGIPRRWIAELGTAAWIWGAVPSAPPTPRFCAETGGRGPRGRRGVALRQVVIRDREIAVVGGVRVTTPSRTLVDLARVRDWDDSAAIILVELSGLGPDAIARLAAEVGSLAGGIRAAERLAAISPR